MFRKSRLKAESLDVVLSYICFKWVAVNGPSPNAIEFRNNARRPLPCPCDSFDPPSVVSPLKNTLAQWFVLWARLLVEFGDQPIAGIRGIGGQPEFYRAR
jgi:hypothetical protein